MAAQSAGNEQESFSPLRGERGKGGKKKGERELHSRPLLFCIKEEEEEGEKIK